MLSEASDGRKRKLKLFFEGSDDKKYKKELSSDAVELSSGFFYPRAALYHRECGMAFLVASAKNVRFQHGEQLLRPSIKKLRF